jgi:cytidylate kinase
MADRDKRIARIAKKQNLSNEEAAKVIDRIDKERDTSVNNVASTSRFDAHNYDIVLNVTDIEPGKAVDFLCEIIQNRFA